MSTGIKAISEAILAKAKAKEFATEQPESNVPAAFRKEQEPIPVGQTAPSVWDLLGNTLEA